jgi:hypothetical protein
MISLLLLSSKDRLGLSLSQLWIPMVERGFLAMETFIRLMRAAWQSLLTSSKSSKISSTATTGSGSHRPCSFSEIVCLQCGDSDPKLRGLEDSFKFWVCDDCFELWFIQIDSSNNINLVYPFECFILRSQNLADAVRLAIDFNGLNDVNGGRKWKKALQKR